MKYPFDVGPCMTTKNDFYSFHMSYYYKAINNYIPVLWLEATELILLNIVLMNDFIVRTVSTTMGIV